MAMRALFQSRKNRQMPVAEPVQILVPELQDAELAAVYYGKRMGGDFYDFLRVGPQRTLFGLLDVAGLLEDNQAIVSAAKNTFRTRGAELFANEELNEAEAVIELCLELNRTILQAANAVHSCPAFAGCYHEGLGTVCYFNAGHTPGLLRDSTGITELPATGLPLGLFSHSTCDARTIALEPDAVMLLVSRGVVEAKCNNEEFGLTQVSQNFQRTTGVSAEELCASVLDWLQQFMCTPPTHNDVTALALARNAASAPK